jgi:hypothetical protein
MKFLTAFALLCALGVSSASAQQGQPATLSVETVQIEILEIEQDVDKTLLKEALLTLGRKDMMTSSVILSLKDTEALKDQAEKLKASIIKRSSEIKTLKEATIRARREQATSQPAQRAVQPTKQDRQEQIEKMESAQAESQLLQRQVQLSQQALTEAIEILANAEFVAANGEKEKEALEVARKQFDKAKSKHVEFSRKFQVEQEKMNALLQQLGLGGMGGGFR